MTYDDGESYAAGGDPDPDQVAQRLQEERRTRDGTTPRWRDLPPAQRALIVAAVAAVLAWLAKEGTLE